MSVFCNVIKPQGLEPFQFSTKISSPSELASPTYTNGISVGTDIRVVDITEVRAALVAIE